MKITKLGMITALKNIGLTFFMVYQVSDIQADPMAFLYAFFIYCIISIPSDIYLLNKAHENGKTEVKT